MTIPEGASGDVIASLACPEPTSLTIPRSTTLPSKSSTSTSNSGRRLRSLPRVWIRRTLFLGCCRGAQCRGSSSENPGLTVQQTAANVEFAWLCIPWTSSSPRRRRRITLPTIRSSRRLQRLARGYLYPRRRTGRPLPMILSAPSESICGRNRRYRLFGDLQRPYVPAR